MTTSIDKTGKRPEPGANDKAYMMTFARALMQIMEKGPNWPCPLRYRLPHGRRIFPNESLISRLAEQQ